MDERQKDYTFLVLCSLGVVAACWEMYTILSPRHGDTFSATLRKLGRGQSFIPFMDGMLGGHLWEGREAWAYIAGTIMGAIFWPLKDGEN